MNQVQQQNIDIAIPVNDAENQQNHDVWLRNLNNVKQRIFIPTLFAIIAMVFSIASFSSIYSTFSSKEFLDKKLIALETEFDEKIKAENAQFPSGIDFNTTISHLNTTISKQNAIINEQNIIIKDYQASLEFLITQNTQISKNLTELSNQLAKIQDNMSSLVSSESYQLDAWQWDYNLPFATMIFFPLKVEKKIDYRSSVLFTFNGSTLAKNFCYLTFTKNGQPLFPSNISYNVPQRGGFLVTPESRFNQPANFVQEIQVDPGQYFFELAIICDGNPFSQFSLIGGQFTISIHKIR